MGGRRRLHGRDPCDRGCAHPGATRRHDAGVRRGRGRRQGIVLPFNVYKNEITIVGSMAVLHSFGRAVDLMAKNVIDADVHHQ